MELDKSLINGSLVLLITFNAFNLLNFIFQFSMARLLTVAEYGVLATLFSLIYMTGVFSESIKTVIMKYAVGEKDNGKIKYVMKKSLSKLALVSLLIFILYVVLAIPLSGILKIDFWLLIITGGLLFPTLLIPVAKGILQGKKRFKSLGANMIVEGIVKLGLGILLVLIGWKVYGAIIATVISGVVALLFSFVQTKDIFAEKEKKSDLSGINGNSMPIFLTILLIICFYSVDVIIAKIFFDGTIAGAYAIASVLAKIIFLGTQPISQAMFPISAEKKRLKDKPEKILSTAVFLLLGLIAIALTVVYFFPGTIVILFSGKYIFESVQIIFYLAIAISLLSISNLVLLYNLSVGKTKRIPYLFGFVALEIILLSIFSSNIFEFSIAFISASAIFLWGIIFLSDN